MRVRDLLVYIVTAAELVLTALQADLLAGVRPGTGRHEVLLLHLLLTPVLLVRLVSEADELDTPPLRLTGGEVGVEGSPPLVTGDG